MHPDQIGSSIMSADELNAQLILSIEECLSFDEKTWERYQIFWFDGRADEFGEHSAIYSLIFYSWIKSEPA